MSSPRRSAGRRRPRVQIERLHGRHVIAAALAARRRTLHRLLVRPEGVPSDVEPLLQRAGELGLPISKLEGRALAELAGAEDVGFQGVVLEAGPLPELRSPDELTALVRDSAGPQSADCRLVALDGVEDPRNLGAIARVAEAAGASGLLLTDRRSSPLAPAAARASAGALEWLPVCRVPNLARALDGLKRAGHWVVAADGEADESIFEVPDKLLAGDLVIVLGAEGRGLRPSIREHADHLVRIPMAGRVASLNVSTAAAVVLFELLRRGATGPGPAPTP